MPDAPIPFSTLPVAGTLASENVLLISQIVGAGPGRVSKRVSLQTVSDFIAAGISNTVTLAANNVFTGNNTFNNPLTVATPTASGHAGTKSYIDTAVNNLSTTIGTTLGGYVQTTTLSSYVTTSALTSALSPYALTTAVASAIATPTITGGTINSAVIGGTTRAAGSFTTLTLTTALGIGNGGTGQTTQGAALLALLPTITGNANKILTVNSGATDVSWVTPSGGGGGITVNDVRYLYHNGTSNINIGFGVTNPTGTIASYWQAQGNTTTVAPILNIISTNTDQNGVINAKGAGTLSLGNDNGIAVLLSNVVSTVNYLNLSGVATANNPAITATGSDTNISLLYRSKGTGSHLFQTNTSVTQFQVTNTASAVNYFSLTGSATASALNIGVIGSDTNIPINYTSKGIGAQTFIIGSTNALIINGVASATNYLSITNTATAGIPILGAVGNDTNISLGLYSKGTGSLNLYTNSNVLQAQILNVASAVNYLTLSGSVTTANAILAVAGTDTNIGLNITTKGTGVTVFNNIPTHPTATAADNSTKSATTAYADNSSAAAVAALNTVIISSTTTSLTTASHNNKIIILNSGASLSITYSNVGQGFTCVVKNNTGADLTPTLSGFTASTMTNLGSNTKIKSGGIATLVVLTPDSGTTKWLQANGDLGT